MTSSTMTRRRFLTTTTGLFAATGTGLLLWPLLGSMSPSERARAAGAPVKVDISKLQPGQQITVIWRKQPVWILRRTDTMIATLSDPALLRKLRDPDSRVRSQQPDYAVNPWRSKRKEIFVAVALCTHLGCIPTFRPERAPQDLGRDWPGGYHCPCHGSLYDLAGRVYRHMPAPKNLLIPPYRFLTDTQVEIGSDHP